MCGKPERLLGSARLYLEDVHSIYLPSEPSARLEAAIADLVSCWPSDLVGLQTEVMPSKGALVLMRDEGVEGFSCRRERTRVFLRSSTDEGLANGLYAICRELLGARWYWEGDLGFEYVGEVADKFPDQVWRERPAFVQRTLHPVESNFGRRNGLNRKYSFNHNLARIFNAEVFEASPEVFAEIGGKRRSPKQSAKYDPQPDFTNAVTVEIAADAAREYFEDNPKSLSFSLSINDNSLFDEGAETEAVIRGQRLGDRGQRSEDRSKRNETESGHSCPRRVSDQRTGMSALRAKFCDMLGGDASVQRLGPKRQRGKSGEPAVGAIEYFRGRPNYTDLVFGFMNEVAERLFEGGKVEGEKVIDLCDLPTFNLRTFAPLRPPSPYLSALAYYWTEQSPSFQIHPKVMPVLTSDRAQWHDPKYRAEDKALIQRWADSGAERIATWDYYFGAPYPYPRQFNQWIIESIRFLNESGVDVFFSQLPSVWGLDGPKAWLTADLLRDPQQDADALLSEFYDNFFGAAAEPIRQFYEIAEQTRNEREGPANWIKFYKDEAGIELFDEATLRRMRECLRRAESLLSLNRSGDRASASGAPTEKCRFMERVKVVSEAFSYTESYAAYHRSRIRLVDLSLAALPEATKGSDQDALLRAFSDYQSGKASFHELKQRLVEKPMHRGFAAFNRLKQSEPFSLALVALAGAGFGSKELALAEEVSLLSTLSAWKGGEAELDGSGKNPSLKHSGKELRNFLGPEVPIIDAWNIQYRASENLRIVAADGQESSGLRVENADIVSLAQTFPVMSERHYLLEIEASWQVSPDNRSWVQLNWESISGAGLGTDILLRLPNGTSEGTQLLQFAFAAPVNAYDLKVGIVTNRQYEGDYLEIKQIDFGQLVPPRD